MSASDALTIAVTRAGSMSFTFISIAVARLDVQHVAVDLLDLAAHAHRLRLLGKARGSGEQQGQTGRAEHAPCDLVHVDPPELSPAA